MDDSDHDLERLEQKTAVVRSVRRVMHALWAISRSHLARAEHASHDAVVYYRWLDDVVERLAGPPRPAAPGARLIIVLGPERSLCGSLVSSVLRQLPDEGPLVIVGTHLRDSVTDVERRRSLFHPGVTQAEEIEDAAASLTGLVLEHAEGRDIELCFPLGDRARLYRQVLLSGDREPRRAAFDTYSSAEDVLRVALRHSLEGRIAHALSTSLRAELAARILTTQRARQACDETLAELDAAARSRRQETVTLELSEVVAAQLALAASP